MDSSTTIGAVSDGPSNAVTGHSPTQEQALPPYQAQTEVLPGNDPNTADLYERAAPGSIDALQAHSGGNTGRSVAGDTVYSQDGDASQRQDGLQVALQSFIVANPVQDREHLDEQSMVTPLQDHLQTLVSGAAGGGHTAPGDYATAAAIRTLPQYQMAHDGGGEIYAGRLLEDHRFCSWRCG
eukprot:m.137901 g.137901  ORF g.137901 m.137901 type:complete len:182 (+) comp38230_c0_seq16:290-835(+)